MRIEFGGAVIADSTNALRVLETSHPPAIYVPAQDIADGVLHRSTRRATFCEWKGFARYFDVVAGDMVAAGASWTYPDPDARYAALRDHVSFYPGRMDACFLDDEPVQAQEGDFYGGWITQDIAGPFKGASGTAGW